jgi:hypothetical protein
MNKHATKSGIEYYRLGKDEQPPLGWAKFVVKMKQHGTNIQLPPHVIAAHSQEDAEKIVTEDYQVQGHGYL